MDKSEHRYTKAGGRKAYLDRNRDKIREQGRARYERRKDHYAQKKREWRIANIDQFNLCQRQRYWKNPELSRKKSRDRQRKRKDKAAAHAKIYYAKHRSRLNQKARDYCSSPEFKSKRAAKLRLRRKTDLNFKIETDCRNVIRTAIKRAVKRHGQQIVKCKKSMSLLGCSIENLKIYLESKFETGMSWDNWGKYGWHIDHIMPCAIFDLRKPEHQKRCFHFSNLQPLWWMDNHRKRDKVLDDQFRLL